MLCMKFQKKSAPDPPLSRIQVATASSEMALDVVVKLWEDEITPRLADLIHSQNSWENFGGVSAIGVFATQSYSTRRLKSIRFTPGDTW